MLFSFWAFFEKSDGRNKAKIGAAHQEKTNSAKRKYGRDHGLEGYQR